jgi:hypothetical protein
MLSPSPSKITDLAILGASLRPTGPGSTPKTAKHERLLPADSALTVAVDDTLFKRSGKKVFRVSWHHDGAAKGPKPIGFGNCWVVAGIVVQLSFLSRPVCLPVLARLWRPWHTTC